MKYIKAILLVALAISFFTSCKKEEGPAGPEGPTGPTGITTTPNPAIYAKWEVVSGLAGTKYAIIKSNNSFYQLDSAQYGFKALQSDLAFITSSQITIFYSTYNYSITNDTLRLTNLNNNIILKKNANAPDETQWVIYISATDIINNPAIGGDGRQEIGFDGTNILWSGNWNSSTIYKINPITATSTTLSLAGNYYSAGVNYAAAAIWISNYNTMDKVNPSTGAIISTSPVLTSGSRIVSHALIGQNMIYSDGNGNVSSWDISGINITPLFNHYFYGMEYVNGFLYLLEGDAVYKCQVSPFQVMTSYYIDSPLVGSNMGGITYDGSHFWVVGENNYTGEYKLVKLSI
jgi:hypothetical protein